MSEDLRLIDLLRSLDRHGVRYVIIGGVAVGLHGYARATKDLDVIIEPSAENIERLWAFIEDVDAEPLAIGDFEARELPLPFEPQSILEGGGTWLLRTRFGRIDIMQGAEGAPEYAELAAESDLGDLEGLSAPVRVCSLRDLLSMKRAAGRSVDLVDIERLTLIRPDAE